MPIQAMAEPVFDHQKQFQAAVDVIHNLPKNGFYRPSYELMLRFYSLYKQAVCGPCAVPRPGFWDPVGRYKWDAWSNLREMSSESAMAAYVNEIKKVAQEVIDTMPMNEKMAALFHHFEPLYLVIDNMPRPPDSLLTLREGEKRIWKQLKMKYTNIIQIGNESTSNRSLKILSRCKAVLLRYLLDCEDMDNPCLTAYFSEHAIMPTEMKNQNKALGGCKEDCSVPEGADPNLKFNLSDVKDSSVNPIPNDSGVSEGVVLNSDSESEIYCDSLDSVEPLRNTKILLMKSNSFHNGIVSLESSLDQSQPLEGCLEVRQVGAGQGGEGAEDVKGQDLSRSRDIGQEGSFRNWRDYGVPEGSLRQGAPGSGGAGQGGGYDSEGDVERLHDTQLQQQIILALRRLREDMRSVMDRLEVVERLAATHTQSSAWRPCLHCAASQQQERWWPFNVSGQTVLLFLVWPFVAQGLVYLLRKTHKRSQISS